MGLVLISAAAAAVGYVLTEIALRFFAVTSLSVALLSNIAGGLSLLIPTLWRPDAWRGWSPGDWLRLVVAALAMFAVAFVLLYAAIGRIGSSEVSLLGRLEVIFVIFLAVVFLGEPWSRRCWVASFLALGGAALVNFDSTVWQLSVGLGEILSVLAALVFAAGIVTLKPLLDRRDAHVVTGCGLLLGALFLRSPIRPRVVAGAVIGLMKALAGRKAKANVIGVVGLVENMPDGNAQRPGDIVTSMSGQTIEILNTDAEGRLVLADALWYTQNRFKPQFMVNLATLTGAIIVALGHEHAGMFSNNDKLSEQLSDAGQEVDEKVWRMPLSDAYDKKINCAIADMKNIGGRDAGSTTAAQFLQRYVNKVPWAHLDIAGTAWADKGKPTVPKGGTGWGVRMLDRLVANHYEGK